MLSNNHFFQRWQNWFLERFVRSFAQPPREITWDIEVFDDPTHGQQQLTLYQGFLSLNLNLNLTPLRTPRPRGAPAHRPESTAVDLAGRAGE